MSDDLPSFISTLRSSAQRLNDVSSTLNDTIPKIEEVLNSELKIGLPARVRIDDEGGSQRYLAYWKIGGNFRITVLKVSKPKSKLAEVAGLEEVESKPWSDCSRSEKIETIKALPALIAVISSTIQERISALEDASVVASTVLNELSRSQEGYKLTRESVDKPFKVKMQRSPDGTITLQREK